MVVVRAAGVGTREKVEPESLERAADELGAFAAQEVEVERRDLMSRDT
jgi:hypothetical protein